MYETFGYTILEAMASGLPVIGSRVGAVPELIEHGRTGLLVPFGDVNALAEAIDRVLSDPGLAKDIGATARTKALQYALEEIGPRHESLYEMALQAS
jgi:2-deoxystreptamine N-acetyl-D-glucosaminyltransferase/2-deoxystreptamine glucosyltransferase